MAAVQDGLTFADPDREVRRRAVERVKEHIDLAAEIGSAVTIGSMSGKLGPDRDERPARRAAALESLGAVCAVARQAGVTVLLEPLNRYECDYINTVQDGLDVMQEIGASNVKLLADTFHQNIEEADMAASLTSAASHVGHVHLVDSNRQAPGHGHLDLRGVLSALREIGYDGYLAFEVLPLPSPRAAAEDGLRTVRAILSEMTAE